MFLGGSADLIEAVKANGGQPGPMMCWFGSWTFNDYAAIDRYAAKAKALGVPLLAQCWPGGDQLNKDFLTKPEGTYDEHQKKMKTRAQAMDLFREIGVRVGKSGVQAIFVVETEYNKGGIEKDPALVTYLIDAMALLKQGCPTGKTVLAPGDWQDLTVLAGTTNRAAFEKADGMGARTMRCAPRASTDTSIVSGADALLKAAQSLRKAWPTKPVFVTDFAIGTYGGDVATAHPFGAKTNPSAPPPAAAFSAKDAVQAKTFERLQVLEPDFALAGVNVFCYRTLKDSATAGISNYYGYGERTFGVVRADGTKKPGYNLLLDLAKPPAAPKTRTEEEYQDVVQQRDRAREDAELLRKERDNLRAKIAAAKVALADG